MAEKKMVEWKWSNGQPYEKSARKHEPAFPSQIQYDDDTQKIAFQQALLSENDIWSLEEQQVFVQPSLNKREDTYNKMAEREMIGQIGRSPFMNRNYLEDVTTQDQFLKPVSASVEKAHDH